MWQTKTFKTKEKMQAWLDKHPNIQWEQIFVNNAWGLTYRPLRVIDIQ